jgi:hypothetical protein
MQVIKGGSFVCINYSGTGPAIVYIGDSPPANPTEGLLWIDTSYGNFILKSYYNDTWIIVQTDLYWDKIDGGSL